MNNKRKNKALHGRRNRWHPSPIIFRYNANDKQAQAELKQLLDDFSKTGFSWAMIPKQVEVLSFKRPRITNYHPVEDDRIEQLESRVKALEQKTVSINITNMLDRLDIAVDNADTIKEMFARILKGVSNGQ